ncbi:MAG: carboxypeptidase regulatory-like domain-containing protein, partial [Acidobacteriaceae bacterium]|nr:carboxypeptidase regulatory-like domain-containing protein [Acidobacteriaceae bacterium]
VNFGWVSQNVPPYGVNWERSTYGFQFTRLFPGGGTYPTGIPYVTIQNFASFQGPDFALHSPTTDIQLADTVSIVKGNHLIKFGGVFIRNRVDQNGRPHYDGQINFSTSSSTLTTGNALADALLGNFAQYSEASADPTGHFRFNQPEAFVQDTWKIAHKLSLEFGVRWQLIRPLYTQGNNMTNFDPSIYSATSAVTVLTSGKIVPGSGNPYNGLVRASKGVPSDQTARVPNINTAALQYIPLGAPRGFYTMNGAIGPRVGFAYSYDDKTSVRGGFGVFYYRPEGNITFSQVNVQPWLQNVEFDNANLSNISGGSPNNTALQGSITAIDPKMKNAYVDNFSLGVQRELPWSMLLETTYVGNLAHHLLRQPNINAPTPAQVASNTSYSANYFNPYLGFTSISQNRADSNSNYNALQVYLTKRQGQITFTSGYTLGKTLGDSSSNNTGLEWWQNRSYNYGALSIDRRHAWISTATWTLPTFAGKSLLLREGIGGWGLTGVYRYQSGPYYSITGSAATLGTRRADQVAGTSIYAKGDRFTISNHQAQWINPAAFTAAPANAFGSAGVANVELPSLQQVDLTASKGFVITERINFKFQADAFNAFNHCNYSSVGTTATSGSSFGRLNGAYPNRQLQLGAKVTF